MAPIDWRCGATDWTTLRAQAASFLDEIFACAKKLSLNVHNLSIDHLGLRIARNTDVDSLCAQLAVASVMGAVCSVAVVNGRQIYIYKLQEPLVYNEQRIQYVELPQPKEGHNYPRDGWEHAEFVLEGTANNEKEMSQIFQQHFPGVAGYRTEMPTGPSTQLPNPAVTFEPERGLCIKFHCLSIGRIINDS